ncbi:hypothetical protein EJV47_00815 [Hymenobacter gummosus]|uniref:DUF4177 domain-containing protein n=1 Tax=Hymenobacter gummosus TaxID=1776032 RepID=A0A431U8X8_9BACT|nr:hypothetical protein [Hymenobacter gummosus]RTQ53312.1 hypothetical protein EJV47_00815 [Hymenobacter gummosus]
MRFPCVALLSLALLTFPAPAPAASRPATTPAAAPAPPYQFMHVRYVGGRIYFSPAYQGKEFIKVTDYQKEGFKLFDEKQLGWEAMSRLLTEFSEQGWELVSVLPENSKDGNEGAIYLLRRPK